MSVAKFDLVALGEPMLEFNQTRGDSDQFLQGFGGDTSNCAIAAARLGASVAYITRLGDDAFGRKILQLWEREGVEYRNIFCHAWHRRPSVQLPARWVGGKSHASHGSAG